MLGAARQALDAQAGADAELDALAGRVSELSALAAETGADLRRYTEQLDADPERLAQIESRRAVLNGLVRKYGDPPSTGIAAVLQWADRARARLDELDVSDDALAALSAARDAAAAEAAEHARALSRQRSDAAAKLGDAVSSELVGLAMPNARLDVEVRPRPASAGGSTLSSTTARSGPAPTASTRSSSCCARMPTRPPCPSAGAPPAASCPG